MGVPLSLMGNSKIGGAECSKKLAPPKKCSSRLAPKNYQRGGASLLDFLRVRKDYRNVQRSYLNLVGSYLSAAAQLNLAMGFSV
jgi:hypothetical protein